MHIAVLAILTAAKDATAGLGKAVVIEPTSATIITITIVIKGIKVDVIIKIVVIATDRDDFTIKTRNSTREDHSLIINSSTNRVVRQMLKEISKMESGELEKDRNFSCILRNFNYLRLAALTIKEKVFR